MEYASDRLVEVNQVNVKIYSCNDYLDGVAGETRDLAQLYKGWMYGVGISYVTSAVA